jgi:hypothetical protein
VPEQLASMTDTNNDAIRKMAQSGKSLQALDGKNGTGHQPVQNLALS